MENSKETFFLKVAHALAGCQYVELALKQYIATTISYNLPAIGSQTSFQCSRYEDRPLGRLITIFEKLCDDKTLIDELQAFKTKRDRLTHTGVVHCLDPEDEIDEANVSEYLKELGSIEPKARELSIRILYISAGFGFEDLTKDNSSHQP
jgi:hypothetical protein